MILSLTLSILLVVSFTGITIWKKKEIPESVSSMVFSLKHPWLWSVWLWTVSFTLAPSLIDAMPESIRFIAFLTIASMMGVGIVPLFDTDHRGWHNLFGIIAGVLSQVCVCFICPWWLLLWFIVVFAGLCCLAGFDDRDKCVFYGKGVFLAEIVCAMSVYCSLL